MAVSATGPGKGGVLERPVIERTTPGRESEFDLRYYMANILSWFFVFHWEILKIDLMKSLVGTSKLYLYLFMNATRYVKSSWI